MPMALEDISMVLQDWLLPPASAHQALGDSSQTPESIYWLQKVVTALVGGFFALQTFESLTTILGTWQLAVLALAGN